MGSVRLFLITSLIMLLFILSDSSSYAAEVVKVSVICKKTKDPSFCSNILNSITGGAKVADPITLAQYTIDVARANITNTIKLIESLIANATDPVAKGHYKMCLYHFTSNEGALGDIENTEKLLKSGDYNGVALSALAVIEDADDCISGESPSDPVYKDPSLLPKYVDFLEKVVDITIVISQSVRQT